MRGAHKKVRLHNGAVPTLHLPSSQDAESEQIIRKTKCAVLGCQPEKKAKFHRVPTNTKGGIRDPRREWWLMLCQVDPDDTRTRLLVCDKHFDKDSDYNPISGQLLPTAYPSRYLPNGTEDDDHEAMDTEDEDDPNADGILQAVSSISLAEENDTSGSEMNDSSSSCTEESESESDDAEERLEEAEEEISELKKKLKVAQQNAKRRLGRIKAQKMPRKQKKVVEKYLRQHYSHAWDDFSSPFIFQSFSQ